VSEGEQTTAKATADSPFDLAEGRSPFGDDNEKGKSKKRDKSSGLFLDGERAWD
jgi:hypothetical protein